MRAPRVGLRVRVHAPVESGRGYGKLVASRPRPAWPSNNDQAVGVMVPSSVLPVSWRSVVKSSTTTIGCTVVPESLWPPWGYCTMACSCTLFMLRVEQLLLHQMISAPFASLTHMLTARLGFRNSVSTRCFVFPVSLASRCHVSMGRKLTGSGTLCSSLCCCAQFTCLGTLILWMLVMTLPTSSRRTSAW